VVVKTMRASRRRAISRATESARSANSDPSSGTMMLLVSVAVIAGVVRTRVSLDCVELRNSAKAGSHPVSPAPCARTP
jgi:hypothetical protein